MGDKLTKRQVLEIHRTLVGLGALARGAKLGYAIAKNRSRLQGEAEAIEAGRIALAIEYAEKDDKGEAKKMTVEGQQSYVMLDQAAFDAALKVFLEESADRAIELHHITLAAVEAEGAWAPEAPLGELLAPLVGTLIEESE